MIKGALNSELYSEWLASIEQAETREAFAYIVGLAASLGGYTCHPQKKGVIRDFRFLNAQKKQPFAFIINQKWLLFYFRLPAVKGRHYSLDQVQATFDSTTVTNTGEWTVKIQSIQDVKRLWSLLGFVA